jgi:DNA-binding transcriptional ArsR family regulator
MAEAKAGASTARRQYSQALKDPRWQRKRLTIFERDGWACQRCHATDHTLNVHHTYYARGKKPWEYPDTALLTLCEACHRKEHAEKDEEPIGPWCKLYQAAVEAIIDAPAFTLQHWRVFVCLLVQVKGDNRTMMTQNKLAKRLGVPVSNISRVLITMRRLGIVCEDRDGRNLYYRLHPNIVWKGRHRPRQRKA